MGDAKKSLFCSWHIDQVWRKNLRRKIKDSALLAWVYKVLCVLLIQHDEFTFLSMAEKFTK